MTQEQKSRFLEEHNRLWNMYDKYYAKYREATEEDKKKMYDRKMMRYELQIEGLRLGLQIMGYTFALDRANGKICIMKK